MTRLAIVDEDTHGRAEARRALLRAALEGSDLRLAARAAGRARLAVLRLDQREAEHARAARRRLGRALRLARARDAAAEARTAEIIGSLAPAAGARRRLSVAPVVLTLAALLVIPSRDTLSLKPEEREAALTAAICAGTAAAAPAVRSAEPVLVPAARYYGPVPSGASETLAAADAYRGAELRKGYARLIGRVVDDASDLPLDDACLAYRRGSLVIRARSDRSGFFAIDLPRAPGSVELLFGRAGYAPARASLASWGANDITFFFDVRLTPR